jgi:hypothetical protein
VVFRGRGLAVVMARLADISPMPSHPTAGCSRRTTTAVRAVTAGSKTERFVALLAEMVATHEEHVTEVHRDDGEVGRRA